MRIHVKSFSIIVGVWGIFSVTAQNTSNVLKNFLQSDNLKHAAISFELKNLASGKVLGAYNENLSLVPASVNKLVTTATALNYLAGNFTYQTELFYAGYIADSVLIGNLYIEGAGDPTLGSEFMEEDKEAFLNDWSVDIRKAGINRINGDIIVRDQLFGYDGVSYKWFWEDMGNYYAPGSYGISIFDNMYRVYLQSRKAGDSTVIVQTIPPIPDLQFTNEIIAAAGKSDDSYISGIPFSNHRRLYGSIPSHSNNFPVKGDIPDPGMCLASYLKFHLEKNKIRVTGQASTYRLNPAKPGKKHIISVKVSPDLASIVRVVNVRSNNHYAEHIYKLLTIKNGIDIPTFWEQKGLDSSALFLFDGSGISPGNAVSASFMNSILEFMYKKEGFSGAFYQSLPWAGKEGTVTSFLKGSALEGKVRVKSGSMTNVQAYSGYITYDGTDYAFTIILNHFTGKRPLLRKQIETLLIGFLGNAQADVGDSR